MNRHRHFDTRHLPVSHRKHSAILLMHSVTTTGEATSRPHQSEAYQHFALLKMTRKTGLRMANQNSFLLVEMRRVGRVQHRF